MVLGMKPVVIDAREVRAKARRPNQKCDRRDAWEICDGLRRGVYTTIVYVPGAPIERLRMILSRRRHFVNICTRQINAAKFLLRSIGLGNQATPLVSGKAWQRLLERHDVAGLRDWLVLHAEQWRTAQEQIKFLEKQLEEAIAPFMETAKRLQTAPAVGSITAATFIASLGTPERFADSSKVVSYIGLGVSTYDSGDRQRHGHITKRGSAELRAILCEAAHHAANARHPLHPYFARICARGGYKKAVICVAQRLARILYQMWRNQENFDLHKLNVIPAREVRTRTIYYKIKTPASAKAA